MEERSLNEEPRKRERVPCKVLVSDIVLVLAGLVYPMAHFLVAYFGGVACSLLQSELRIELPYAFFFVYYFLPTVVVTSAFLGRASGILHFRWRVFAGFAGWIALIGFICVSGARFTA